MSGEYKINKDAQSLIDKAVNSFREQIMHTAYAMLSTPRAKASRYRHTVTTRCAELAIEQSLAIISRNTRSVVIQNDDWKSIPISDTGRHRFSVRARNVLAKLGCCTMGDAWNLTPDDIRESRNCGPATICEVASVLGQLAKADWYAKPLSNPAPPESAGREKNA